MPPSCGTGGDKGGKEACAPKKNCCWTMIKGAIVGGIVAFAVLTASWTFAPWHMQAVNGFKDEKAVAKTILDNAPQSGVYALPLVKDIKVAPTVEKPFAFVSVKAEGFDGAKSMYRQIGCHFAVCLLIAGLLTCILKKQGCGCPIMTSAKVGVIAALMSAGPAMIWWHFPLNFVMLDAIDTVLAITLAGAVISRTVLCSKKGSCSTTKCG